MFLLDTNAVSYAWRREGRVAEHIERTAPSLLWVSTITIAELQYGAELKDSDRLRHSVGVWQKRVQLAPFDAGAAIVFGKVAAHAKKRGHAIGVIDLMLAAQALALGATLVTHNVKHFKQLRDLVCEDWY